MVKKKNNRDNVNDNKKGLEPDETANKGRSFTKEKFRAFMDRYGFYVILFMCICIIAATALVTSDYNMPWEKAGETTPDEISKGENDGIDIDIVDKITPGDTDGNNPDDNNPNDKNPDDKKADGTDADGKNNDGKSSDDKETDSKDNSNKDNSDNENTAKDNSKGENPDDDKKPAENPNPGDETAIPVDSEDNTKDMIMPVAGEIIKDYSMDKLVYSDTLKEWTVHTGIDIKGEAGAEVKAAKDGVIESIVEDTLMGIMITIDHGDGIKTVYSGLSSADMVTIGQEVAKGHVISGVGQTAAIEVLSGPHLHFEVFKDDMPVDPKEFIE